MESKNGAFYTAAAGKRTKLYAGGDKVEREDSLLTDEMCGEIIQDFKDKLMMI